MTITMLKSTGSQKVVGSNPISSTRQSHEVIPNLDIFPYYRISTHIESLVYIMILYTLYTPLIMVGLRC
jgi:hypothetical protein